MTRQERIEEAAKKHSCYDEDCEGAFYELIVRHAFIEGADFALKNQWISVEEALPEKNTMCFVRKETELGIIYDADYVDFEGKWFFNFSFNRTSIKSMVITHWMPIPSLEGGEE